MRIALFTETFLPKVDGIVTTLRSLLEHCERRGVDVLVFAPRGAPSHYASARVIGLPGLPAPFYPELRLAPPLLPVGAALDRFGPDLLHAVNPVSLCLSGMRYAQRRDLPIVASYHTDLAGFASRWGLGAGERLIWRFVRRVHGRADLNLCPSRDTLETLDQQGIPRLAVWGRGVDTRRFHPGRRDDAMRRRLSGGEPERPLLLYVGRLAPEKRVDWLAGLLDAHPEARLAVVGDGPSRPALESAFAGRDAVFTGYLHGEELAAAYASADAFPYPGANETFGNVILEAMASGLPVVAPRSGGLLDHLRDGDNGLLYAPESPEDLARQTGRVLREPGLADRLSAAGLAKARRMSWAAEHDRLLARYAELVDRSRAEAA